MKNCKKCGAPIEKGSGFCTSCGAKAKGHGALIAVLIILGVIILAVAVLLLIPDGEEERVESAAPVGALNGDYAVSPSREKYTQLRGDGSDTVTIMLYMVGSNLETESGCATSDLIEMSEAALGANINIIVETGGALEWQNDVISGGVCERYSIEDGDLVLLQELGETDMASTDALADFVSFAATNYPADRYQLIMWNHGGGTMGGFGYDEMSGEMMSISQIGDALGIAGVTFDFIGFDACLMATVETAYMLEPYADYLVASEEIEPGDGWYYTDWLTSLGENSSLDTEEIGKQIIDDYVASYDQYSETTLSMIDLTYIVPVYEKLCAFLDESERVMVERNSYSTFSNARAGARDYGEGEFEQIDIVDYVTKTGLPQGDELIGAIGSAVAYSDGSLSKSYGLAMYFPYAAPDYYEDISYVLSDIGMGDDYTEFFDSFLNILAGGQIAYGQSASPLEELLGVGGSTANPEESYSEYEWFDQSATESYEYAEDYGYNELTIDEKGDGYVLSLTDEDWESIVGIELQIWYDDGEGYLDLGSDSLYEFDDDGDLIIDYDNTWVAINGQIVSFYTESYEENEDGSWYNYGYVPCFINDVQKELVLCWTDEYPGGFVVGYRDVTAESGYGAKGTTALAIGDTIDFIADYYTYNGDYEDWYYVGETLVYDGSELAVSYEDVGDATCLVYYMLTDIYQNYYYTEAMEYSVG